MAFGAMEMARLKGFHTPRYVSIVGFDDIREAAVAQPPLTTVHQPRSPAGHDGGRYGHPGYPRVGRRGRVKAGSSFEPQLVSRESVAPPRMAGGR